MKTKTVFFRYVLQGILAMVGISFYVLADTFFITRAEGADGMTALNLVLPVYNLIFALGAMLGIGSAIRYSTEKTICKEEADRYFQNALFFGMIGGIFFSAAGLFGAEKIAALLGGDPYITKIAAPYTRIFMAMAPFFIWNSICGAFVRNDGGPFIAMTATLVSSMCNVVLDYLFMFPLHMGMAGAALATGLSPVIGILICCVHFFSGRCTIRFRKHAVSLRKMRISCKLGFSACISELSGGVVVVVLNMLLLQSAGNKGVAAYGIISNTAIVGNAVLNGLSNGAQPLLSESYGAGRKKQLQQFAYMTLGTAAVLAVIVYMCIYRNAELITALFNRDGDRELAECAVSGLRLYFIGILPAALNIASITILSSMEAAGKAFAASILRGGVFIIAAAMVLARLAGISGIWLAFPTAEAAALIFSAFFLKGIRNRKSMENKVRI